jgi:hypothetical protein
MSVTTRPRPMRPETEDRTGRWLLESELLDLYAAILIVVPVAMFLRSLWP